MILVNKKAPTSWAFVCFSLLCGGSLCSENEYPSNPDLGYPQDGQGWPSYGHDMCLEPVYPSHMEYPYNQQPAVYVDEPYGQGTTGYPYAPEDYSKLNSSYGPFATQPKSDFYSSPSGSPNVYYPAHSTNTGHPPQAAQSYPTYPTYPISSPPPYPGSNNAPIDDDPYLPGDYRLDARTAENRSPFVRKVLRVFFLFLFAGSFISNFLDIVYFCEHSIGALVTLLYAVPIAYSYWRNERLRHETYEDEWHLLNLPVLCQSDLFALSAYKRDTHEVLQKCTDIAKVKMNGRDDFFGPLLHYIYYTMGIMTLSVLVRLPFLASILLVPSVFKLFAKFSQYWWLPCTVWVLRYCWDENYVFLAVLFGTVFLHFWTDQDWIRMNFYKTT